STLFHGQGANCWKTTARSGPGPFTGCPPTITRPFVGASNPAASRRQVVLPHPDGPTRARTSLSATVRSIPSSAGKVLPARVKYRYTFSKTMEGILLPGWRGDLRSGHDVGVFRPPRV